MPKRTITPSEIKSTNRKLIYDYIYANKKVSQQDISYNLGLSRPTVASNLNDLEAEGLIFKDGRIYADQIGRKASAYSISPRHRVAIGVEIVSDCLKIMAVDLYGEKIDRIVEKLSFENTDEYYKKSSDLITGFISSLKFGRDQVLGVGIAVHGIVSPDQTRITYGAIMDITGLEIRVFSKYIPYPCSFIHDSESAALSEVWFSPDYKEAVFILLSYHVGGAIIENGGISFGKHGHNATMEHIKLRTFNGSRCYCGHKGCAETLLSTRALMGDMESEVFMAAVRRGDPTADANWKEWLKNLGILIGLAHLVYDRDFILGGYMAEYITPNDLSYIYQVVNEYTPFEEDEDFIKLSIMPKHGITLGGTLPYIKKFLSQL